MAQETKNKFDYHVPNEEQVKRIEELRSSYKFLGQIVNGLYVNGKDPKIAGENQTNLGNASRYAALANTYLEISSQMAVKAIMFNDTIKEGKENG